MIRQNATLAARIAKLERRKERPALPRISVSIHPNDIMGEPVGWRAGNVTFLRLEGEALQACQARALAATAAPFIFALYGPQEGRGAAPSSPIPTKGANSPDEPQIEPSNPFERAGIGRRATADELWHAGWTRGPAERLR